MLNRIYPVFLFYEMLFKYSALNDIIGLVDSNMNEVVTYTYDSWGKLLNVGGSLASTMHLKVSIIDSSTVTTGSFNYTLSAQNESDENLVVINNTAVNAQYESQFARMWSDSSNFEDWNG